MSENTKIALVAMAVVALSIACLIALPPIAWLFWKWAEYWRPL